MVLILAYIFFQIFVVFLFGTIVTNISSILGNKVTQYGKDMITENHLLLGYVSEMDKSKNEDSSFVGNSFMYMPVYAYAYEQEGEAVPESNTAQIDDEVESTGVKAETTDHDQDGTDQSETKDKNDEEKGTKENDDATVKGSEESTTKSPNITAEGEDTPASSVVIPYPKKKNGYRVFDR